MLNAPQNRKKTTILLVDDHALLRRGLADFIKYEVDLKVIGEAADGGKAFSPGIEKSLGDTPAMPKLTDKQKGHT